LPLQTVPQSPQFCLSTLTLVQTAAPPAAGAHDLKPPGQAHMLSWQISPLSHFIPQAPQLAGLLTVLVQTGGVPHSSVFWGQVQTPPLQARPPLQTMPQPPQLFASASVTTHAAAHSVSPLAQSAPHAPCEQTWVLPHAVVHFPQWVGSVSRSTQTPLQSAVPAGQPHTPCAHVSPPVQALPQAPQFLGSVFTLMQAPPQSSCCVGQPVLVQAPFTQASPAPHVVPQAPQFRKFACVSTQTPLHSDVPTSQAHLPAEHIWPEGQAVSQAPQLFMSLFVSTQAAPHCVRA